MRSRVTGAPAFENEGEAASEVERRDKHGQCHATLARIAESEGDTQAAATLWEKAYELNPSSHAALAWSTWLREQGEEQHAAELEAEALAQLRQGSDSGA